jgi:hypothetical protein
MEKSVPEQNLSDAQRIDQLVKAGGDVSKLYSLEFTLRFPTQKAAERAELQVIGFAFATKIERGRSADQWLLLATKKMYPVESDLSGLRDKLNAIAAGAGGTYEGWKARPL